MVGVQLIIATMETVEMVLQEDRNQSKLNSNSTTTGLISEGHFILPQRHLLNHVQLLFYS